MENSVVNIVKRLIIKRGRATYWFVDDFVACGNYASVKKALQQLTNEHMLLRISSILLHSGFLITNHIE